MDIRVTSFSPKQIKPKLKQNENPPHFARLNGPIESKPKRLLLAITANKKSPSKDLNSIFMLSKNSISTQPNIRLNNKGVQLYQQIERGKLFTNGAELVNRFNFKA